MNTRDMLREICRGRYCSDCKANERNINCLNIDKGRGTLEDCRVVEELYYELLKDQQPLDIFEDDIMQVFK